MFGMFIEGDHVKAIKHYSKLYRSLGITIPPKVHVVEAHLATFLARKNTPGFGLAAWTEQAFESCHHDFKVEWEKFSVSPDHPEYEQRLQMAEAAAPSSDELVRLKKEKAAIEIVMNQVAEELEEEKHARQLAEKKAGEAALAAQKQD